MNRSAIAVCVAMSLGVAGCTQTSESRGALRGGGIGAAAGALASLFIPGLGFLGGAAIGGIGGAGIGVATSQKGKTYRHSESERRPVADPAADPYAYPADPVPAEAPPGG